MTRLLLAAALAAAAFATPAAASHECDGLAVGHRVGDLEAGVCVLECSEAGCTVATVYCEGVAPAARYCQVLAS
jgi:hypothetical protein